MIYVANQLENIKHKKHKIVNIENRNNKQKMRNEQRI